MSIWHDPNKHDSLTLLLCSATAFFLGIAAGAIIAHYVYA